VDFEELLDPEAQRRELLAVELRLCRGVSLSDFQQRYGALEMATGNALRQLAAEGFLQIEQGRALLTDRGRLFYDSVASELI
jgi:oxygen-independent coproporphyrinogen-3 oxidase